MSSTSETRDKLTTPTDGKVGTFFKKNINIIINSIIALVVITVVILVVMYKPETFRSKGELIDKYTYARAMRRQFTPNSGVWNVAPKHSSWRY